MKKKFFLRRLFKYCVLLLIPMLPLFTSMVILAGNNVDAQITDENHAVIAATEMDLDLVLNSVITQNLYIAGVTRLSLVLGRALDSTDLTYGDNIYIKSLNSMLSSIIQAYDYIDDIYIYLDGMSRALSSGNAITTLSGKEEWLAVYQSMNPEDETLIAALGNGKSIAVCQRLLLRKGCIVVILDRSRLSAMLDVVHGSNAAAVYLIDKQGNVLATTDNAPDISKNLETIKDQEDAWLDIGEETSLVSSAVSLPMEIRIISAVPRWERNRILAGYLNSFIIFLAVDIIVAIFIAYAVTKRSFSQIYTMFEMFENAEKGIEIKAPHEKPQDEYDAIMNNMLRLFLNTSYLKTQLKEKQYCQENAELMALQLQINPHFLYNTLQTIDIEARKTGNSGRTSILLRDLTEILKYSLSDPNQSVTLSEELSYLKKYVEIQRYRFGDHFIVYYDCEEELLDALVFRLMLQPVLENSLLHGIRGKDGTGYVRVRIKKREDMLKLSVVDNGRGMTGEELETLRRHISDNERKAIGLSNLNRRLILRYGTDSALKILSHKGIGTTVTFMIPYMMNNEVSFIAPDLNL
jgi:two-component system, sensor histidine kinase YesM